MSNEYLSKNEALASQAANVVIANTSDPQFPNANFEGIATNIIDQLKSKNNPYTVETDHYDYSTPLYTSKISFMRENVNFGTLIDYLYDLDGFRVYEETIEVDPFEDCNDFEYYESIFRLDPNKTLVIEFP